MFDLRPDTITSENKTPNSKILLSFKGLMDPNANTGFEKYLAKKEQIKTIERLIHKNVILPILSKRYPFIIVRLQPLFLI